MFHRFRLLVGALALVLLTTGCTGGGPDQSGVFVTRDAGSNWLSTPDLTNEKTDKPDEYPPLAVTAVAVSPIDPNFVVAGTEDDLYQTTDGGGSWEKITERLPTAGEAITVQTIRFHPTDPDTYYVTGVSAGYGKVLRTTDRGATLTDLFTVSRPGQTVTSFLVDANDPQTVLAGDQLGAVYRSRDGGTTWRRTFTSETAITSLSQSGTSYFAGTLGDGIFRSSNSGASFVPASGNLAGNQRQIWSLASGFGALYAGTEAGLVFTHDFGATWQSASNPLPPGNATRVHAIAISGSNVFFATNAVVYRTNATGDSFLPVQLKLAKQIFGLAATPADTSVLYAAVNNEGTPFAERYSLGQPSFIKFNPADQ